jgi:antirestriction protein
MPNIIPSNTDDLIDSRDIIERIKELNTERARWVEEQAGEEVAAADFPAWAELWTSAHLDDAAELAALQKLAEEAEGYADDWTHGVTLIHDDYFTDYAREMLEDCGTIPRDLPTWVEIDWEATARNVRTDYTYVDFDGVTYWVR